MGEKRTDANDVDFLQNKTKDNPTSPSPAPESPTTVRPFEMDDDDVPESGVLNNSATNPASATLTAHAPTSAPVEEMPPAQPPRPIATQQSNELILKEAFPNIEVTVIKAVLVASGGQIDPAFNALLSKAIGAISGLVGFKANCYQA